MNKYQEALECLKDNLALRPYCRVDSSLKIIENNTERTIEFDVHKSYTLLKELVDKQEEYRWHDLRKNPNDLPTKDAPIIIKQGAKYHSGLAIEGRMGNWTTLFSDDGEVFSEFAFVDKWKYIEDFEDESEGQEKC